MLHSCERTGKADLNQRGRGLLAGAGEVAIEAVRNRSGMQFDEGLPVAQLGIGNITFHHERRHCQWTDKASRANYGQLEFECDQHGRLSSFSEKAPASAGAWSSSVG